MAEELRWVTMHAFGLSGDTDGAASWTNQTGDTVTIRDLSADSSASMPENSQLSVQITKQNSVITADGDTNWQVNKYTNQNNIGDVGTDANGYLYCQVEKKYGAGQVEVEPGETVYMHLYQTGTPGSGTVFGHCTLGYHKL